MLDRNLDVLGSVEESVDLVGEVEAVAQGDVHDGLVDVRSVDRPHLRGTDEAASCGLEGVLDLDVVGELEVKLGATLGDEALRGGRRTLLGLASLVPSDVVRVALRGVTNDGQLTSVDARPVLSLHPVRVAQDASGLDLDLVGPVLEGDGCDAATKLGVAAIEADPVLGDGAVAVRGDGGDALVHEGVLRLVMGCDVMGLGYQPFGPVSECNRNQKPWSEASLIRDSLTRARLGAD